MTNPTIDKYGNKFWYNEKGQRHRDDGPACEFASGTKYWYVEGKQHRLDGPAVEHSNGDKQWWVNDKCHRVDGPAVEYINGDKEWIQNGQYHRLDGPAVEKKEKVDELCDSQNYYINGIELSKEQFDSIERINGKLYLPLT